MGHTHHKTWVKALALTTVALYGAFAASAVRYTDPELRAATRSSAIARRAWRPAHTSVAKGRVGHGTSPAALIRKARKRLARAWDVCLAPAALAMPAARPHGEDALGVSLPRRCRWAVLGGHGRNGPGSKI